MDRENQILQRVYAGHWVNPLPRVCVEARCLTLFLQGQRFVRLSTMRKWQSLLITVMALSRVLVKPFVWSVTFIETVTMITWLMVVRFVCVIFMTSLWIQAWGVILFPLFPKVVLRLFLMPNLKNAALFSKKQQGFSNIRHVRKKRKVSLIKPKITLIVWKISSTSWTVRLNRLKSKLRLPNVTWN